MSQNVPAAVRSQGRVAPEPASADTTARVREKVRELRDLEREKLDAEERLKALGKRIEAVRHKELVDLFDAAKLDTLGLPAEGNLPAYDARMSPYYYANIAADWAPERRAAAFQWLEDNGHGDLAKRVIAVQLGRGAEEEALARRVMDALRDLGVAFTVERVIPWNTLTAFVKEQDEKQQTLPLDLLGATIGRVVKLKQRKEK